MMTYHSRTRSFNFSDLITALAPLTIRSFVRRSVRENIFGKNREINREESRDEASRVFQSALTRDSAIRRRAPRDLILPDPRVFIDYKR